MKKILLILLLGLLAMKIFALEERGRAVIYTTESQVITTDEILVNFGKKWNVSLIMGNERIKSNIDINSIKRIDIYKWDTEDEWWIEAKIVLRNTSDDMDFISEESTYPSFVDPDTATIAVDNVGTNKSMEVSSDDNRKISSQEYIVLANPDSLFQRDENYVVYKKYDPVNNELVKNRIWSKSIRSIEFGSDIGLWKIDSKGNIFNPDYIYSPYTGEKMQFGSSN